MQQHVSIADSLRKAIRSSGRTLTAIATASKVHRVQLSYFLHRHQDLSLANADKVMRALGMQLTFRSGLSSR